MATVTRNIRLANPRPTGTRRGIRKGITRVVSAAKRAQRSAKRTAARGLRNAAGQFIKAGRRTTRAATKLRRKAKSMTARPRPAKRTTRRSNPVHIYTLGLLGANPASKTGTKKVSKTMATKRKRKSSTTTRRRRRVTARRRSNPVKAAAPRRRRRRTVTAAVTRRRRRRSNPVAAPRRRARRVNSRRRRVSTARRRNPSVFGTSILSSNGIKMIGAGLLGVALTKVVGRYIPASLRMGGFIGDTLIAGASAVGVGMLLGKFLGDGVGNAATLGGLMYAGSVGINGLAPGLRVMDTPLTLSGMGVWADARFTVPQNPITAGMMASVAPPAPANVTMNGLQRSFGAAF